MSDTRRSSERVSSASIYPSSLRALQLSTSYHFNQSQLDALTGMSAINAVRSSLLAPQAEGINSAQLSAPHIPSADVHLSTLGRVQSILSSMKSELARLTMPEQHGSSTIGLTRDREALTVNVRKLVDTFNTARAQLIGLNGDTATRELSRLQEGLDAVLSGFGRERVTLVDLGVVRSAGGDLTLSDVRLGSAMNKNIEGVVSVLGDSIARLSQTAQTSLDAGLRLQSQQFFGGVQSLQGNNLALSQGRNSADSIPFSTLAGLQRYWMVSRF